MERLSTSKVGSGSAKSLCGFLEGAQSKAGYRLAIRGFDKRPGDSAKKLWTWLQTCDWTDTDSVYATAFAVVGFRKVHDQTAAQKTLDLANEKIVTRYFDVWPRPILKYLSRAITKEELFRDIDFDRTSLTDARFFVAMNEQSKGDLKAAKEQLEWIYKNGERDAHSYAMAESLYRAPPDATK